MADYSLYQPPRAEPEEQQDHGGQLWRRDKLLIVRHDAHFPGRCIKCNAPAQAPRREIRLYWHAPGYYLLVLLNAPLYAIVAVIVRKRAALWISLCEKHQSRLRLGHIIGWGGLALLVLLFFAQLAGTFSADLADTIRIALPVLLVAWLVATFTLMRYVVASRIDDNFIYLKGCDHAFLDSLPEFTRPAK